MTDEELAIILNSDEWRYIIDTAASGRLKERFPITHIVFERLAERIMEVRNAQ